ncbi:MAG TPA: UDP-N-acetylmuramoyl-tripeptide--D-alanyl-D-alanine ligase [Candidatus Humimicrobiaceae bacterium]
MKTGKKINIKKLIEWSGCQSVHDFINSSGPEKFISSISTDSRTLEKGDFFIPVSGPNFDGHDFIEESILKGAIGFVIDGPHSEELEKLKNKIGSLLWDSLVILKSQDNISFLLSLAAGYIRQFNPIVIGITGSVGKTTTKDFLVNIFKGSFNIKFTAKNYNTELGIAVSILEIDKMTQFFIAELGMRAKGQIGMLSEIINLDIGAITAVGPSHLEFFNNVEEIALAKAEMAEFLAKKKGILFLNNDDDWAELISRNTSCRIIRFGRNNSLDYNFIEGPPDNMGVYPFDFNKKGKKLTDINMPLPGLHNVYNSCCAAAICSHLGLNPEMIKTGLENAQLQKNRMRIIRHREMIIINDCYNANPLSMKRAIDTLKTVSRLNNTRSVAILADMLELGPDSASLHIGIGKYLSENTIDVLIAYGPLSENICSGFSVCDGGLKELSVENETDKVKNCHYFKDKKQLCGSLGDILKKDDTVLFKGSRANKLEDIIEYLLKA